jgi:hypothetical protein
MPNYNWNGGYMSDEGGQHLADYVNRGGRLLTTEWAAYDSSASRIPASLAAIIPISSGGFFNSNSTITFTQSTADPTMDAGLGSSFTITNADSIGGTESKLTAKPGATTFFTSSSGAGAAGMDVGAGRVLSFSLVYGPNDLNNPDFGRLFGNGVDWLQVNPVPEPPTLVSAGLAGLTGLGYAWRQRRRAKAA